MNIKLLIILLIILSSFLIENITALYTDYVITTSTYNNIKRQDILKETEKDPYPQPISSTNSTHSSALYGSPLI